MARITSEIEKMLESGDYRIVEPDETGKAQTYPGEIIMMREGIVLAYTANVKKEHKNS